MSIDKKHISFTAADIEAYLNGSMSPAQMHAMEKAALEDPFLADALEGYQQHPVPVSENSRQLQDALSKRIDQKARAVPRFPVWMRYAALVAGVTLTFLAIRLMTKTPEDTRIVQNERVTAPVTDTNVNKEDSASGLIAFQQQQTQPSPTELPPVAGGRKIQPTEKVLDRPASEPVIESSSSDAAETADREVASNAAPAMSTLAKAMPLKVAKGIVVDQNNQPVPGAIVKLPAGSVATDPSGYFTYTKTDTAMQLEVRSVGFSVAKATVLPDVFIDTIVLTPSDMALNEVVVVGYGTSNKAKSKARRTTAMRPVAEPDVSLEEYNDYITDNLEDLTLEEGSEAEMIVSFMVSKNGSMSDFKVERPAPTEAITARAMQLIRNGPKWKVNGGDSAKATVIVKLGHKK